MAKPAIEPGASQYDLLRMHRLDSAQRDRKAGILNVDYTLGRPLEEVGRLKPVWKVAAEGPSDLYEGLQLRTHNGNSGSMMFEPNSFEMLRENL